MDPPGPTPRADETNFALSLAARIALFGDEAILSSPEFAAMRSVSDRINHRERLAGTGCPYVLLSARRIGYRYGDCKAFLRARRVGVVEESAA
jgi:hypothetical protein